MEFKNGPFDTPCAGLSLREMVEFLCLTNHWVFPLLPFCNDILLAQGLKITKTSPNSVLWVVRVTVHVVLYSSLSELAEPTSSSSSCSSSCVAHLSFLLLSLAGDINQAKAPWTSSSCYPAHVFFLLLLFLSLADDTNPGKGSNDGIMEATLNNRWGDPTFWASNRDVLT
eukprot:1161829-Pelagomonas_calceolata.AAC.2